MSYRIQYDTKKHPWQKRLKRQKYVLPVGIICISLLTLGYFGIDKLQFLLPGEPSVTAAALDNMTNSLQEGETLQEAITAFCREILDNAQKAK
jgi:hypothetical protein